MKSYEQYEAEVNERASHRPHCEVCKEPIWDDEYYETHDHYCVCEACFDEWAEKYIEQLKGDYKRYV